MIGLSRVNSASNSRFYGPSKTVIVPAFRTLKLNTSIRGAASPALVSGRAPRFEAADKVAWNLGERVAHSPAALERIVLLARRGTPVLLRDVATVREGAMQRQGAVTRDGRGEVVSFDPLR